MIMEQALGDVEDSIAPDTIGGEPLEQCREVALVRLVRADLLGGHDPVEGHAEPTIGSSKQVVIAIRQDAESEAGLQTREGRRGIRERGPVDDRAAKRGCLVVGDRGTEVRRDRSQPAGEDLAIAAIRSILESRLGVGVALEKLVVRGIMPCDASAARSPARIPVSQSIRVP